MTAQEMLDQAQGWLWELEDMMKDAKTAGAVDVANILTAAIEDTKSYVAELEPLARQEEEEEAAWAEREYEAMVM